MGGASTKSQSTQEINASEKNTSTDNKISPSNQQNISKTQTVDLDSFIKLEKKKNNKDNNYISQIDSPEEDLFSTSRPPEEKLFSTSQELLDVLSTQLLSSYLTNEVDNGLANYHSRSTSSLNDATIEKGHSNVFNADKIDNFYHCIKCNTDFYSIDEYRYHSHE